MSTSSDTTGSTVTDRGAEEGRFRPVARILDKPLGIGVEWIEGIDYDTDPTLDDGVILYVKDDE